MFNASIYLQRSRVEHIPDLPSKDTSYPLPEANLCLIVLNEMHPEMHCLRSHTLFLHLDIIIDQQVRHHRLDLIRRKEPAGTRMRTGAIREGSLRSGDNLVASIFVIGKARESEPIELGCIWVMSVVPVDCLQWRREPRPFADECPVGKGMIF